MWREHAHVSALAGLLLCHPCRWVVGIENRVSLQHGWGRTKGPHVGLSGAGAPCVCSASFLWWCGYIPMLSTSPLRYGEGELAFSNIKISLEGKNGTDLGREFVTQMGDS
jgi:hypothetical protein